MTIEEVLAQNPRWQYELLGRMQADCLYYLGYGMRCPNRLWATNEKDQISFMKAIWENFPKEEKPVWLTWGEILEFEKQMVA